MRRPGSTTPNDLHVLFVDGGDGRAARLAAHWARTLAGGALQVKASGVARLDSAPDLDFVQPGLLVLIHTRADSRPVVSDHCGGRIDWEIGGEDTGSEAELSCRLRQRVMHLLGELGMAPALPQVAATPAACRATDAVLPARRDGGTCLLAA